MTRERIHWGYTLFWVNDDPEISQLDAEYDPELSQSEPIICQVCRKLTKFRVTFDPELSMTPMDHFLRVTLTRMFLECSKVKCKPFIFNLEQS